MSVVVDLVDDGFGGEPAFLEFWRLSLFFDSGLSSRMASYLMRESTGLPSARSPYAVLTCTRSGLAGMVFAMCAANLDASLSS